MLRHLPFFSLYFLLRFPYAPAFRYLYSVPPMFCYSLSPLLPPVELWCLYRLLYVCVCVCTSPTPSGGAIKNFTRGGEGGKGRRTDSHGRNGDDADARWHPSARDTPGIALRNPPAPCHNGLLQSTMDLLVHNGNTLSVGPATLSNCGLCLNACSIDEEV